MVVDDQPIAARGDVSLAGVVAAHEKYGMPWPVDGDATIWGTPGFNVSPQTARQPQGGRTVALVGKWSGARTARAAQ